LCRDLNRETPDSAGGPDDQDDVAFLGCDGIEQI
jgi:hypothetical protein